MIILNNGNIDYGYENFEFYNNTESVGGKMLYFLK